ncbi:MAG: hypothetical protein ACREO0_10920 [Pseudoxanthomonas sp.]
MAPELCSSCEPLDKLLASLKMRPATKASRVVRVLIDGPATTLEVAAETGMHYRTACSHLSNLFKRKKIARTEHVRTDRGYVAYLWTLKAAA